MTFRNRRRYLELRVRGLSASRVLSGLRRRLAEVPHTISWELDPVAKENRRRLEQFKGRYDGQRCFIVANGPSLAQMDLGLLERETTFGTNRIYLLFPTSTFRPTYYVAVDELVLELFGTEIAGLTMPKFLNWNRRKLFAAERGSAMFLKSRLVLRDSFQYDLTRPVVMGGTVTFVALQIAYYMGFKTTVLIGLDHNYADPRAPLETLHFHPEYLPQRFPWQPDVQRSELDYEIARVAYEADGRQILDATPRGRCAVFKKVEYSSLF